MVLKIVGIKSNADSLTGCQKNYLRWEDAWNADGTGVLPADWTPGYTETLPDYNDLVQRSSNYPNPNSGDYT